MDISSGCLHGVRSEGSELTIDTGGNQVYTVKNSNSGYNYATYGYDANGNTATRTSYNGVASSYAYDAMNGLTDITWRPITAGLTPMIR